MDENKETVKPKQWVPEESAEDDNLPSEEAICLTGLLTTNGRPMIDTDEVVDSIRVRELEDFCGYEKYSSIFEVISHVSRDATGWLEVGDIVVTNRSLQMQYSDIIRTVRTHTYIHDEFTGEDDPEAVGVIREKAIQGLRWCFQCTEHRLLIANPLGHVCDIKLRKGTTLSLYGDILRAMRHRPGVIIAHDDDNETSAAWPMVEVLFSAYSVTHPYISRRSILRTKTILSEVKLLCQRAFVCLKTEGKVPICVYPDESPLFWAKVYSEHGKGTLWVPREVREVAEGKGTKGLRKGKRSLMLDPLEFLHMCSLVAWPEWSRESAPFKVEDKRSSGSKPIWKRKNASRKIRNSG